MNHDATGIDYFCYQEKQSSRIDPNDGENNDNDNCDNAEHPSDDAMGKELKFETYRTTTEGYVNISFVHSTHVIQCAFRDIPFVYCVMFYVTLFDCTGNG